MTASILRLGSKAVPGAPGPSPTEAGFVTGGVRKGLAAFAVALAIYAHAGFSSPAFAPFVLAPDLSMLAYLAGPRTGAIGYNLVHTYVLPLLLALAGFGGGVPIAAAGGLIWIAHIGLDRLIGCGLKYPTAFGDTHLGRLRRY